MSRKRRRDNEYYNDKDKIRVIRSQLWFAIGNDDLGTVKKVIENNPNLNINEAHKHNGRTPLHFAAIQQNTSIYDYLVNQGADENLKDKNGNIPEEYLHIPMDIDNDYDPGYYGKAPKQVFMEEGGTKRKSRKKRTRKRTRKRKSSRMTCK